MLGRSPRMTDTPYLLERVGPAAVVQLHAEAFARLPLRDKRSRGICTKPRWPVATSTSTSATSTAC